MAEFRIYVREGCEACKSAAEWLKSKPLPAEMVIVGNDPVLNAGVDHFGAVPLLVSFLTNEYVVGFQPKEYERLHALFVERSSPGSFRVAGGKGNGAGAAADVAEKPAPSIEGTAGVPGVSGAVANGGDSPAAANGNPVSGPRVHRGSAGRSKAKVAEV